MLLEAKNISFQYKKGAEILSDVNFSIESGEIVGLTASSGFGKTTLARMLAGYEKPTKGEILLDGKRMEDAGYHPVQMIFQHPEKAVNPKWKMKKILSEVEDFSDEMIEKVGIQREWMERWPIELSGGELQRFCVLRALNSRTRFIIADEMTTMLDAITQAQIWEVVIAYAKENKIGIVVVSHEKDLLKRICERIVSLEETIG